MFNANCQKIVLGHLSYLQQVEGCIGGWVSAEEASVHCPMTELFEAAVRGTPAQGDSSCRFLSDFRELAVVGICQ
jgi:hypothetical protein